MVGCRSSEGSTPVHTAAAFGRCENLRLLLLNGGDPFFVDQVLPTSHGFIENVVS